MTNALPDHVPAELAKPFALTPRKAQYSNPFTEIIPELHKGPDIFYGTDIFPGPSGGWVIRRADDLKAVYENTEDFIKKGNSQFAAMIGEDWDVIPTELDPPVHDAFRKALNPVFSPKKMAELQDKVRNRAKFYIDQFKNNGSVDFMKDFAVPYPVSIVLDMLDLPQDRMPEFLEWEFSLLHTNSMEERAAATLAVKNMLLEEIEKREKNPGDDLISTAMTLEVNGRKWNRQEVFGFFFNLFLGGLDTVSANLSLHFHHLATHLDHQRTLREHPEKIENAVQEFLRGYAAVTTMRICKNEFQLHGVTIKPGDRVAMSTPLGSNDPAVYENPSEIDLDRRPNHLTFGWGIHRCLGNHLARREINVAIEEMLKAIPEFTIKPGFEVPFYLSNIIHIPELPLVWNK